MTKDLARELFDRAALVLERASTPTLARDSVRVQDIVIYRSSPSDKLMMFRSGRLVFAYENFEAWSGRTKEDFTHALDVLRRYMVLEDMADL